MLARGRAMSAPERDTVAVLRHTAEQRELDAVHWTLARTDAASVRKLAALLGTRDKAMPGTGGHPVTPLQSAGIATCATVRWRLAT